MKNIYLTFVTSIFFLFPNFLKGQTIQQFQDQYIKQVKENAAIEAKIYSAFLQKKYGANKEVQKKLERAIYEQRVAIQQAISISPKGKLNENALYSLIAKTDSLINYSLISYGTTNNLSKFSLAIQHKSALKLTQNQVDSLFYYTKSLQQAMIQNPDFAAKDYERKVLPKLLSEEQYVNLLIYSVKNTSSNFAQNDWKEIKERGLATGQDSAKVIIAITNYNIGRLAVYERFGNNLPKTTSSFPKLENQKPEILQLLHKARLYNNPIPDKTAKATFSW